MATYIFQMWNGQRVLTVQAETRFVRFYPDDRNAEWGYVTSCSVTLEYGPNQACDPDRLADGRIELKGGCGYDIYAEPRLIRIRLSPESVLADSTSSCCIVLNGSMTDCQRDFQFNVGEQTAPLAFTGSVVVGQQASPGSRYLSDSISYDFRQIEFPFGDRSVVSLLKGEITPGSAVSVMHRGCKDGALAQTAGFLTISNAERGVFRLIATSMEDESVALMVDRYPGGKDCWEPSIFDRVKADPLVAVMTIVVAIIAVPWLPRR